MHPRTSLRAILASVLCVGAIASGANTALPASTPAPACMDQWLFNGVWRVQVTKVDPMMDGATQVGWTVTEIWRNGTDREVSPADSLENPQILELSNGSKISTADTTTGSLSNSALASHDFPASGQFTFVQQFRAPGALDPSNAPKAVDVTFDAATLAQHKAQPQFTSSHYDFRFKLDCKATGAAANAAGGSSEIAGAQGCLNQWMSNGIWRMRATAIGPDSPNGTQIGWAVTEQWTNQTNRKLAPADTLVGDQQLVFASGNTLASSNSAGSSMSMQKLTFNDFAPGASLTYVQLFRPTGFDATEKPVKLIVTFDATAMKQRTNMPQYKANPPNFRISLGCVK